MPRNTFEEQAARRIGDYGTGYDPLPVSLLAEDRAGVLVKKCLSEAARTELEDFALEAARALIDRRSQMSLLPTLLQLWGEAGIDGTALIMSLQAEREELTRNIQKGQRLGPVRGFVIPPLWPAERTRRHALPQLPARQLQRRHRRRDRRGVPAVPPRPPRRHC